MVTRFLAPPADGPLEPGRRPAFSVLIAVHNAADVIGEAIDSALRQTFPPLEIIVCDDGSTDRLDAALEPYRDRIVLLRKEQGGEASAKNAAARAASGEFVVILDADDVFLPTRLEALAELAAARPDLDILTTDAILTVDGREVRRCYSDGWTFEVQDQRREILKRNFIFGLAAVRRELLLADGGFDEHILWTTDWDRWLRLILEGSRVGAVAEPLALYRVRESSLSARRDDLVRGKIATLEKARANSSLRGDERLVLDEALAGYRRELALAELGQMLARGDPGVRRRALGLTTGAGVTRRQRAGAAAAALAPATAGRVLRSRAERFWTGAGGTRVDRRAAGARVERALRLTVYTDATEFGGAERSLANLVAALSPPIEIAVLGVDPRIVQKIAAGRPQARSVVVPFVTSRHDLRAILAHVRALVALRPDIFHANLISPWSSHMAIFIASLLPRVRVVAVEQLPTPPASAEQRRLKRLIAKRLSAHVAVGECSARETERLVGLRRGSVTTIYNGVPDAAPGGRQTRPDGAPTIGAIGRLEQQKGFDVLLRALPHLPGVEAVLVGEGSERARLEQLAGELGVGDRVQFVGWVDEPRTRLESFDVFVLPSRFEGFPLAVVEAMLAELPVVASDVGAVREAVLDGRTGLVVAPDDPQALAAAVRELLADPARRQALGVAGRALALERYTAEAMARGFESLYDEIRA